MKTGSSGEYLGPRGMSGEWRRLHNEAFYSFYRSPNIVRVIKSRRLRWAGHVATMEEDKVYFKHINRYTYRKETFR